MLEAGGSLLASTDIAAPRRAFVALALAALACACSSKETDPPGRDAAATSPGAKPTPAPPADAGAAGPLPAVARRPSLSRASTDAIWRLAPPAIQFGAVVADGGFEKTGAALAELGAILSSDPEGASLWSSWTSRMRESVGFDLHDTRRWASVGLDPSRGGALFGTTGSEAAMVLPVADTDAFRVVFGLTSREIDGVTVDVSSKLGYCVEVSGRYVCADSSELIAAIAAGKTGPLARRAMGLPQRLRGTVEIVADLSAFPGARRRLRSLDPAIGAIGLLAIGARLDRGRLTVEAWLAGQRKGRIGEAFANLPAPRSLRPHLGGALGVVGIRAPLRELFDLGPGAAKVKLGASDLDALVVSQLTGQIALITRGRGLAAGAAVVGLADGAGLRAEIEAACALLGRLTRRPAVTNGGSCRAQMAPDTAGLPVLPGLPAALRKPIPIAMSTTGDAVVIAAGEPAPATGPAPGFALEPAHAIAWGRALDPLATAPAIEARLLGAAVGSRIDERSRRRLAVIRRLLNHVYEAGIRGRLDADGIRVSVDLVSFAADPDPVYAAYKIAVDRLLGGDHAGYRRQIAALAAKHPDTLVADQAEMVAANTPAIGPGTVLLSAIALRTGLKYIAR